MPLTLTQLHTFSRLAAIGNFTRTAEELALSQPAVTQQVRALADHFETPLFDMVGRRPVLTDAGAFLAQRAVDVLAGVDALEREMREFADAHFGTLDIGVTVTIGNYAVLATVAAFRKAHPAAMLRLTVANTAAIVEAIRNRRFGVALVEGPVREPEILVEPYAGDELTLIVPPHGHRLSGRNAIDPAELDGEAFCAREEGSGTRIVAEDALHAVGVTPDVVLALPGRCARGRSGLGRGDTAVDRRRTRGGCRARAGGASAGRRFQAPVQHHPVARAHALTARATLPHAVARRLINRDRRGYPVRRPASASRPTP